MTVVENEILGASFSEEDVREAVFGSYVEGAPGPDGFSFLSLKFSRISSKRI